MTRPVTSTADPAGPIGRRVHSHPPAGLRVVSAGVDSLYLSAKGELWDGLMPLLTDMRHQAETAGEPTVLWFNEEDGALLLRPHGWRRYPIWLSGVMCELYIGAAEPVPPVYVMLHAAYIHTVGVEDAVGDVERLLSSQVFPKGHLLSVSRVDLYADQQGWIPSQRDFGDFVCRAVQRTVYEVPRQMHARGRQLSGFTFGKGDVVARIYNKTLELRHRGETWPELLWQGADKDEPVWRVEFQFRGRALRAFGVSAVEDVLAGRQDLWEYGTRWLSLRRGSPTANRSRWPERPAWREIRAASMGSPRCGLVRDRVRALNELRLVRGLVGYASSLGALNRADDLGDAMRAVLPAAGDYMRGRGVTFADLVEHKRRTRLHLSGREQPREASA